MNQSRVMGTEKTNSEQGFTLLEVIVAISILAFGLLAVASMQASSIVGNSFASDVTEGTTWASDKTETIFRLALKNYNDPDNLEDEDGDGSSGLEDEGGDADYSTEEGKYTISYNVAENFGIANTKTIQVIVTWSNRGDTKKVKMRHMIPQI